jgi:hypothetical protein
LSEAILCGIWEWRVTVMGSARALVFSHVRMLVCREKEASGT